MHIVVFSNVEPSYRIRTVPSVDSGRASLISYVGLSRTCSETTPMNPTGQIIKSRADTSRFPHLLSTLQLNQEGLEDARPLQRSLAADLSVSQNSAPTFIWFLKGNQKKTHQF